jgi:hypothetical protein
MEFETWLAKLLGQSELKIGRLLKDSTAVKFLIAWSLFESKCFDGFVKIARIDEFARRLASEAFDSKAIRHVLNHFYDRYQKKDRYRHLMHGQQCSRMDGLLGSQPQTFVQEDEVFFVTLVAYRFRNNMFHGSKGVQSWLQYREQIRLCTSALERFVSHAEYLRPSLSDEKVAVA